MAGTRGESRTTAETQKCQISPIELTTTHLSPWADDVEEDDSNNAAATDSEPKAALPAGATVAALLTRPDTPGVEDRQKLQKSRHV